MRHSNRGVGIELPPTVAELPVAPHRYHWNHNSDRDDTPGALSFSDWKKLVEYQPGEVVYVAYADSYARAYISLLALGFDQYGDRRPTFRVHRETKAGTWSRLWYYTWPGFIQLGYLRAGFAPDCLGKIEDRATRAQQKMKEELGL